MSIDSDEREELYQYFLAEVPDLLKTIEETLISLLEEKTVDKVHTLMRSAHTLKGSAASIELETIQAIAHQLEDVFEALYSPELEIDPELGSLLLEGYECLRTPLSATLADFAFDEIAVLEQTTAVFEQLRTRLGDFLEREAPIFSSEELGFDVVGSIFTETIPQELEQLAAVIANNEPQQIEELLRSQAEFLIDLGASYSLPGLQEIAQTVLQALAQHPDQVIPIAQAALENFTQAKTSIVAGERDRGGEVKSELRQWTESLTPSCNLDVEAIVPYLDSIVEVENAELVMVNTTNNLESDFTLLEQPIESEAETVIENSILPTAELVETRAKYSPLDQILQSIWTGKTEPSIFAAETTNNAEATSVNPSPQIVKTLPSIRVAIEQLDRLNHTIGELFIKENQQNLQSERLQRFTVEALEQFRLCQQQLSRIQDWSDKYLLHSYSLQKKQALGVFLPSSSFSSPQQKVSQFDVLEMDVYSELHLLLQTLAESVMQLGQRIETIEKVSQQSHLQISKRKQLLNHAQEELFQARMVSLSTVFNRFPRLLQQLVATHGKPAVLKLRGTEVMVDKAIAEKLYDPLLHLIRNAYAHGLESTSVRLQQRKSETGQINIRAYHQGNLTTIEVQDDGGGLNWESIRAKAIASQIMTPLEAANASEAQLIEVLFKPGFSTASTLTDLSGRGVGLDVVWNQVQALKGSISVRSVLGQGTTFVLQLPLSLTTARLLLCQNQNIIYALLSTEINQIILPLPQQIHTQTTLSGQKQTFLRWGNESNPELIPICAFADLLQYEYPLVSEKDGSVLSFFPLKQQNQFQPLLMLQIHNQKLCLKVEQILTEQELVIKTLGNIVALPNYIQGYSVLGDSSLALVINPVELVADAQRSNVISSSAVKVNTSLKPVFASQPNLLMLTEAIKKSNNTTISNAAEVPKILVIEDSVVQRQSLKLTLEKGGYQVIQAGNGQEAIAYFKENPEITLVICDVEMPVMNGFEFLDYCRNDSSLSQVPIIMLTSRSSPKHRQTALSLGAKFYLTKPYSNQELLETLAQLINFSQI
ncbi:CheA signal transduction histidine kinase [Stanieria cyanosphaera PCC 7437]|uniref:histidine kinase n=1 Tax=Stanieria cyanosphaera (strain ATCC 29371 / PCC 7437) TaxID=111780 RepID=K9XZR9_STAC7|nr:response regulator [Stanieria cyanosphaera]AFZ37544.1 CheA signal transduction histidine kinase [Stanieria cyanosphaera PCC 7437]